MISNLSIAQKVKLSDMHGTWVSAINDSYFLLFSNDTLFEIGLDNEYIIHVYNTKVGFIDRKNPVLLDHYKKEKEINGLIDADTIWMVTFDIPEDLNIEILKEQKNENDYFYYGGTLCYLGIEPEDLPSKVGSRFELINSNVFVYNKVERLPNEYLRALYKKGKKDNKDYLKSFFNMDFKEIKIPKSIIHSAPNQPTKMYLIKGDEVEFLEEQGEWYKIRFYGKKTIEGWVRKSDVE